MFRILFVFISLLPSQFLDQRQYDRFDRRRIQWSEVAVVNHTGRIDNKANRQRIDSELPADATISVVNAVVERVPVVAEPAHCIVPLIEMIDAENRYVFRTA